MTARVRFTFLPPKGGRYPVCRTARAPGHPGLSGGDIPSGDEPEGHEGGHAGVEGGGEGSPAEAQFGGAALDQGGQDLTGEDAVAARPRVDGDVLERAG